MILIVAKAAMFTKSWKLLKQVEINALMLLPTISEESKALKHTNYLKSSAEFNDALKIIQLNYFPYSYSILIILFKLYCFNFCSLMIARA